MNLADTCGRDCFRSINLVDVQAGLVLVEVLANQPGPLVVWPDERLAAVDMIEPVRVVNLISDEHEVGAQGELMEGNLIADPPILYCEAIIGVPQYGLADAVVKRSYAFFPFDNGGVRTPAYPVHGMSHHHVGRQDLVVLPGAFQVHMPPEVEKHGPMQRLGCAL